MQEVSELKETEQRKILILEMDFAQNGENRRAEMLRSRMRLDRKESNANDRAFRVVAVAGRIERRTLAVVLT